MCQHEPCEPGHQTSQIKTENLPLMNFIVLQKHNWSLLKDRTELSEKMLVRRETPWPNKCHRLTLKTCRLDRMITHVKRFRIKWSLSFGHKYSWGIVGMETQLLNHLSKILYIKCDKWPARYSPQHIIWPGVILTKSTFRYIYGRKDLHLNWMLGYFLRVIPSYGHKCTYSCMFQLLFKNDLAKTYKL